ncbi:MAG: hypothetical protein JWQ09_5053, partial [Segetibacter sp.]|nr:hypothetical protein [Segetibacter sp.]
MIAMKIRIIVAMIALFFVSGCSKNSSDSTPAPD